MMPAALSIAGSDSGGGAGIQMDLRVFRRLGVLGTTAITAVTAQNLEGVTDVFGIEPDSLTAQVQAVLDGFDVRAIKTGMLWSRQSVEAVVAVLATADAPVVVDPVMIATTGARLLDDGAIESYGPLLRRATLVTPNLDEADVLAGRTVDRDDLRAEAERLVDRLGTAVLLKGGHLEGAPRDVLATGTETLAWDHDRVAGINSHGSGCMLSSAITARLAVGDGLVDAVAAGLAFAHDALARATGHEPALAQVELARVEPAHLRKVAM